MGRRRDKESGMGLLPRMEAIVGKTCTSYRYKTADGKNISLGRDRLEAIRQVLDLLGRAPDMGTVRWVWEKYQKSRRWLRLADDTRTDYEQCAKQVLAVFGHVPIGSIDAPAVARYVRIEREDAPVRANREKALLSNLFAMGIDLGVCTSNPAKSVRPNEEDARPEAPNAEVLATFLDWVSQQTPQRRIIGLAAKYAALAGNRKVEFLDLVWPQVDFVAGEVRTKRAKQRGKQRGEVIEVVTMSDALRACLLELQAIGREDCLYVFPTRDNRAYSARGFKTLWQRIMVAAIEAGVISKSARFTFHDLRAFYTTTHKQRFGELPDLHKNKATTARVYDRSKAIKRSSV